MLTFRRSRYSDSRQSHWSMPVILGIVSLVFLNASYAQIDRAGLQQGKSLNGAAGPSLSAHPVSVALTATLPPTLTVSVSEIQLNILINGAAQNTVVSTMPVSSSWVLNSQMSGVDLLAYFDSPQHALSDAHDHFVPSDHIFGGLNNQVLLPFAESPAQGTPGASRVLYRQPISGANYCASRTDFLRIQLRGLSDLDAPRGEYRGTLHLRLLAY